MQASNEPGEATVEEPTPPSDATRSRRRHSARFKAELVRLASDPDRSVASVAREHHVNANQLFRWIADARRRTGTPPAMVPVAVSAPVSASTPHGSAHRADRAALEVALPQATLRLDEGWDPNRVAALVRLLGS